MALYMYTLFISLAYVYLIHIYIYTSYTYAGVFGRVLRVQAGAHRVPSSHLQHTEADTCTELVCMRHLYGISV